MNQSTKIVGFLVTAFFVFITVRGELPVYLGFLLPGSDPNATASAGTSTGNTSQGQGAVSLGDLPAISSAVSVGGGVVGLLG